MTEIDVKIGLLEELLAKFKEGDSDIKSACLVIIESIRADIAHL